MKKNIALIFGGRSKEADISILSATNIARRFNREKFFLLPIFIDKIGTWHFCADFPNKGWEESYRNNSLLICPGSGKNFLVGKNKIPPIDVIFCIIHGQGGEDGCMQGLAEMLNVPIVGPQISSSSICMDKDLTKKILREGGISVVNWEVFYRFDSRKEEKLLQLSYPCYVKPSRLGSSIGISRVKDHREINRALEKALACDSKVIVEPEIKGKEVECAVLGNFNPRASIVGEIITPDGFYSYEEKYSDKTQSKLNIPANLKEEDAKRIREIAILTYKALDCRGMSRIDFFITKNGNITVNEVNTLPGFTDISMYPSLWEASGITWSELLSELVELAEEAAKERPNE